MFFVVSFVMMSSLTLLLLSLGLSLSFKSSSDREKASPFECGFTPKYSARLPFSIRFFLIAIIFLIFDVELILIFPLIPAIFNSSLYPLLLTLTLILILLLVGLSHEIFQGSLSWAN